MSSVNLPYLIQRCESLVFDPSLKTGDYLLLDYMGAAEFEFGAFPKAQKEIISKASKLVFYNLSHVGQDLWFACEPHQKEEYAQFVRGMIDGTLQLKCDPRMSSKKIVYKDKKKRCPIYDHPDAPYNYDVWFDLTNALIISRSEEILKNVMTTIKNSVTYSGG